MKRLAIFFLAVILPLAIAQAQTVSHDFQDVSLSEALLTLDNDCDTITVNFVYDDLEDFRVTTNVCEATILEAVTHVCGYYPMRITQLNTDIFVECTQRDSVRFIGQVLDAKHVPVRFANVTLLSVNGRDTLNYGVTNDDGYFVIPCSSSQAVVRITHVSYFDFEKTCHDGDVGVVSLKLANNKLDPAEAVGSLSKANVTKRSYHSLWRQAYKYSTKHLPRSQMGVMDQIMAKARHEANYGQLLAAEMMKASLAGEISPDSIPEFINGLVEEERSVNTRNPILAAVYQTVLANVMKIGDYDIEEAEKYRKKAVENAGLLAANKAEALQPFVTTGTDSKIFDNDLLSVIGMQTDNYQVMRDYYAGAGNRQAEMYAAFSLAVHGNSDSKGEVRPENRRTLMVQLDSLIDLYGDMPECCEVAIARYKLMCVGKRFSVEEKMAYLDEAVGRWPEWKNTNTLRNYRSELTRPAFKVDMGESRLLPDSSRVVRLYDIRNVKSVKLRIMPLNVSQFKMPYSARQGNIPLNARQGILAKIGDDGFLNTYRYNHYIREFVDETSVAEYRKQLHMPNDWQLFSDSLRMEGLPPGNYIAEITADECAIDTIRFRFSVSDVYLLAESLPRSRIRLVAVRGTTGHPIAGAKICQFDQYEPNDVKVSQADANGEVILSGRKRDYGMWVYASTDDDHASPAMEMRGIGYYGKGGLGSRKMVNIYTDRAIYRPGQEVSVAMVTFQNSKNIEIKPLAGRQLKVTVFDANQTEVMDTTLVADDYGTAFFSFKIPEGRRNGGFRIAAASGKKCFGMVTFRVEDYKRPTFKVEFLPRQPKADGASMEVEDSLTLKGCATAFSGAPMAGAQVRYTVKRGLNKSSMPQIFENTVHTDQQGDFVVKIPTETPETDEENPKWVFQVKAIVTDLGGESHEADKTLTMASKKHDLTVDWPKQKMDISSQKTVNVQLSDKWGEPIDTTVVCYVDRPDHPFTVMTNTLDTLPDGDRLALPGEHALYAVFDNDTVKAAFFIVDYQARRPGTFTRECFAQSDTRFPSDGGNVDVQFGTSLKDVFVVYDLFADNKRLEGGSFWLNDEMYNRSFSYRSEYGSGVCMTFAFIKDGVVYREKAVIEAPMREHQLDVNWETFRDRLSPGQEEEWTMKIRKVDGTPAKAQLLAVLYDASLDQIVKPQWWERSQLLGFYTASTNWKWPETSNMRKNGITMAWSDLPTSPLSWSHFDDDLLSLRATGSALANFASVSKTLDKGSRKKGKRGYVSGIVVDEEGEPIIGASVIQSGTNKGTVTNIDGEFEIKTDKDLEVVVSYVGYQSLKETLHRGKYNVLQLVEDYTRLDEVVVIGYGTQKKSIFTGIANVIPGVQVRGASSGKGRSSREYAYRTSYDKKDEMEILEEESIAQMSIRENMNETAFFQPNLISGDDGSLAIRFKLPESVTTWRFLGMAHDLEMNMGTMDCTAMAQKEVMVQPNLPRFLRVGDKATITARVANIGDKPQSGVAVMQLTDAETEKVVYTDKCDFFVEKNATTPVSFSFVPDDTANLLVCRVSVSGTDFADGEQGFLPVLPDREMTTDSYAFTMHQPTTLTLDVDSMLQGSDRHRSMTIEYTDNPVWMMVTAMPTLTTRPQDNAISQAVALYVNRLGENILNTSPLPGRVISQWREAPVDDSPLIGELQKNDGMYGIVLAETPWVMDAKWETSDRRNLMKFFDKPTMNMRIEQTISRLKSLQRSDGGWAWWKGMPSSRYTTLAVMEILARLNRTMRVSDNLHRDFDVEKMLGEGLKYLDKQMKEDMERETKMKTPSEDMLHYLYVCALVGDKPDAEIQKMRKQLMEFVRGQQLDLTIFGKAACAVIMAHDGQKSKAHAYLQSLKEYAVTSPERGMYFDTPRAQYTWCDATIPTVTMAIEALRLVEPEDTVSVELMRRWLLSQRRTKGWGSAINSINAIHAFLGDSSEEMSAKLAVDGQETTFTLDGKPLHHEAPTAGIGYVKMMVADDVQGKLNIVKTSPHTSWGTVVTQSMRRTKDVGDASSGMSVTREIVGYDGHLHVGDKVRVRITIKADQDYDFVQITDKRAACLEPVDVVSGYRNGCYRVMKDNATHFYADRLRKGTTVLEAEYFVDRPGKYETGSCTVQCVYAPAFSARASSLSLSVEPLEK
ncbi:MAG: carboxypeptidase-like regulatory domain-containing protein [Prevotella sp.]|nr:carboxypeptidase-like regulatory domain-containing protein [Prevotella sp.]